MAIGKFEFATDFQEKVIFLLFQDLEFLSIASQVMDGASFTGGYLEWFFTVIRNYFLDFGKRITKTVIKNELLKLSKVKKLSEEEIVSFSRVFNNLCSVVEDKDYVKNNLLLFIKHQRFIAAVEEALPLLKRKKIEEAYDLVDKARTLGSTGTGLGINLFSDYKDLIDRNNSYDGASIFPLGVFEVDRWIRGGGLMRKEMGIILAPSNRGKSIVLCNIGKRAIISGHKVVHYTLEMSDVKIADRYFASWSGIPINDIWKNKPELTEKMGELATLYKNSLIIKEYPSRSITISNIKAHIKQLQSTGFYPDLVVIDYGELLRSTQKYKDAYDEQSTTFAEMRGLASEFNCGVWTATQANRKALTKEVVGMGDVGDSFGKMQHADIVIALCQTTEEYNNGVMRLFMAKNRDGVKNVIVPIRNDFARMAFAVSGGSQDKGPAEIVQPAASGEAVVTQQSVNEALDDEFSTALGTEDLDVF